MDETRMTDYPFERQVTVFVDLLGTSDRALRGQPDGKSRLLALLKEIAAMRADFSMQGKSQEDGSFRFRIAPAVSTFSDNVVLSFTLAEYDLDGAEAEVLEKIYLDMVLRHTRALVGKLATSALKIGALVRGGMTLGDLYHSGGVVLGSALVEAYGLESRVSIYPRVTISPSIYSRIHINDRRMNMRLDKDGIFHLDYFRNLHLAMYQDRDLGRRISDSIDGNIHAHQEAQKWNEYAKWHWFRSELSDVQRENPRPEPESNVVGMPTGYE